MISVGWEGFLEEAAYEKVKILEGECFAFT